MRKFLPWVRNPVHALFLIALVLGIGLRLYRLGEVPAGLTWDEAVITYDAWGIADWHRDQYANFMPLVFKSFGDYKPPLMHYVLGAIFILTGVNIMAVRAVSAVAGILLIPVGYWLGRELFPLNKWVASLTALGIALSPWSIHMSRVGLEANIATTMVALAVLFFLWGRKQRWWVLLSVFTFGLSVYMYQSTKMVAPLLLGWLLVWKRRWVRDNGRFFILVGAFFLLMLFPFWQTIDQGGLARGQQALVFFTPENTLASVGSIIQSIGSNFIEHFSLSYLTLGEQETLRNIVPGFGVMYNVSVILWMAGLVGMFFFDQKEWRLIGGWMLIGWLPSILSSVSPHTLRSATSLPAMLLFASYGAALGYRLLVRTYDKKYVQGLLAVALAAYGLHVYGFLGYYFGEYVTDSAYDFQYGYEQALEVAREELRTADKLVVTDAYEQPYIYTLLYFGYTPQQFQQGVLANVAFHPITSLDEENVVYVGTPAEIPPDNEQVIEVITLPQSSTPVFVVART